MGNTQHRREHARLRLGIEATLISLGGEQQVVLQDLSRTGAKLFLEHARPVSHGFLRWMSYEVFVDAAWRKGHWCGVQFDEPVPEECLLATRAAAPALMEAPKKRLLQHAKEFVQGTSGR